MTSLLTARVRLYALQDAVEGIGKAWADDWPHPGDDLRVRLNHEHTIPLWKVLALLERLADEQRGVLADIEGARRGNVRTPA